MTAARTTLPAAVAEFARACETGGLDHLSLVEEREALRLLLNLNFLRFGRPGPGLASVSDHDAGGVRVRIYRPVRGPAQPAHLYLHGGGWWQGSIDDLVNDATCRYRAAASKVTVVALDYPLAPEHRYPSAIRDCCDTLRWIADNRDELGLDPGSLSVGGNSAGANLAAATALAMRHQADVELVLQILEVPVVDLTLATVRESLTQMDLVATTDELERAANFYLGASGRAEEPLVSPLLAPDLSGLPPALIATAEYDPLRLEGRLYAERLERAGVPAAFVELPGAVHGAFLLTRTWDPAMIWQRDAATALRQAHAVGSDRPGHRALLHNHSEGMDLA